MFIARNWFEISYLTVVQASNNVIAIFKASSSMIAKNWESFLSKVTCIGAWNQQFLFPGYVFLNQKGSQDSKADCSLSSDGI